MQPLAHKPVVNNVAVGGAIEQLFVRQNFYGSFHAAGTRKTVFLDELLAHGLFHRPLLSGEKCSKLVLFFLIFWEKLVRYFVHYRVMKSYYQSLQLGHKSILDFRNIGI